ILSLAATARGAVDAPKDGVVNRAAEWTFTSSKPYADPFNDVELDMLVTAPDGSQQRIPAFWAGEQTWRARVASAQAGVCRWKTECSDRDNRDLHDITGSIEIKPYTGENPLYRHGFLRVAADKKHFEHADGTRFFWLADTWWMGLTK